MKLVREVVRSGRPLLELPGEPKDLLMSHSQGRLKCCNLALYRDFPSVYIDLVTFMSALGGRSLLSKKKS